MAGKKKTAGARKTRAQIKREHMEQVAKEGAAPQLPNMPNDRDLKHHFDTVTSWKAKLDEVQGNYRNALKQAEECGLDTKSLVDAMKKGKKDPYVLKSYFQQMFAHLVNMGLPIQLMIFDTIKGTPDDQAYKGGYDCGKAGQTPNNIYPAGSSPHKAYARGLAHGIGENLGQTKEQVDAALAESGDDGGGRPAPMFNENDPPAQQQ